MPHISHSWDDRTGQARPGSPSIILSAIQEAEQAARATRTKEFRVEADYFFIERDKDAYCSLELTLKHSEHASELGNSIHVINDDFAAQTDRLIEFVSEKGRAARSIFVLDQCGYDKVPFSCVRKIMGSLRNAEVILTFAADFLIDYLQERRPN
jgi:three-Cys-motif partner protein